MSMILDGTLGASFNDGSLQGAAASPYVLKNRIINGAMQIWQRGTSFSSPSNNSYTADRWAVAASTSLTTVAQSSDVPSGFKYSLSINGTNNPYIYQRIESLNCSDLGNQTITISFWLKQSSGAGSNSIGLQLYYANTADTFSSQTQIGSTIFFTATNSWVQYTTTFTNISANAVNGLNLIIYANTGSSATFLITGVQLEIGSTATPFERRLYGQELVNCQRYYEVLTANGSLAMIGTTSSISTQDNWAMWQYKVEKRATPSVSLFTGISWGAGTPTITPSTSLTMFFRTGVFYTASATGNVLQASAEL